MSKMKRPAYIMKNKIKKSSLILICIYIIMITINAVSWMSTSFADWYAIHILPVWVRIFSPVTSSLSFSVGDIMITLGVAIVAIGFPAYIICMIICRGKRKKISRIGAKIFLWIIAFVITTETLNCFIMYHCSTITDTCFCNSPEKYSTEQMIDVYEIVAGKLNDLSSQVPRDSDGHFILTDDLYKTAESSMKNLTDEYPRLKGFYPRPKKMIYSRLASQQYLMGIFLPFSLEVNYNPLMEQINYPSTVCHEYAHLKGIMQEDEAGFISFLACICSESDQFQYSGYLSVLPYLEDQVFSSQLTDADKERADKISGSISWDIYFDDQFLSEDTWKDVEDKAVISTEVVNKVDTAFTDTSLKLNGVTDGIASYDRKVELLLDYYNKNNMLNVH